MKPEHEKEMEALRASIQMVDADILHLLEERIGYVLKESFSISVCITICVPFIFL